jgi:hypothetical protein
VTYYRTAAQEFINGNIQAAKNETNHATSLFFKYDAVFKNCL